MTPNECLELLRREPFIPFRVRLKNGKKYEVKKPNTSLPRSHAYMIGVGNWNGWPDHHEVVPWEEIDSTEDIPLSPKRKVRKHAK